MQVYIDNFQTYLRHLILGPASKAQTACQPHLADNDIYASCQYRPIQTLSRSPFKTRARQVVVRAAELVRKAQCPRKVSGTIPSSLSQGPRFSFPSLASPGILLPSLPGQSRAACAGELLPCRLLPARVGFPWRRALSWAFSLFPATSFSKFTETYFEISTAVDTDTDERADGTSFQVQKLWGERGTNKTANNLVVSLETKGEKKLGRERRNRQEIDAVLQRLLSWCKSWERQKGLHLCY